MIFNAIIRLLSSVFNFILNIFPPADPAVTTFLHSAYHNFYSLLAPFNWIFPVDVFATLLGLTALVFAYTALLKLVRWIGSILTANLFH